jgi:hypothetical protein
VRTCHRVGDRSGRGCGRHIHDPGSDAGPPRCWPFDAAGAVALSRRLRRCAAHPVLAPRSKPCAGTVGTVTSHASRRDGTPVAGAAMLIHAFARFVAEGLGTPAPVAPTAHLVVGGLYRYVRNPMYLAVIGTILGQALRRTVQLRMPGGIGSTSRIRPGGADVAEGPHRGAGLAPLPHPLVVMDQPFRSTMDGHGVLRVGRHATAGRRYSRGGGMSPQRCRRHRRAAG